MSDTTFNTPAVEAFSFGDPEPVLQGRGVLDYLQCLESGNGRWYEPPINMHSLAQAFHAAVHHSSAIHVKRNILLSTMEPTPLLSRQSASRLFKEYLAVGNCYLERRRSLSRKTLRFEPSMAKYTRRGLDLDQYFFVPDYEKEHPFARGAVWHLMEPDLHQEIYGVPEWLASLHSALLNEAATLFRRKYYQNGSHAGYILYMSDPAQNEDDIAAIRKAMKDSKGPGNFRNMFVYRPGGKPDGVKVIPVSEVAAKDEFLNIKNVTRDDQMAAHRVPWQIMGIPPMSGVSSGDPRSVAQVFARNEVEPLQAAFLDANEYFGEEIFRFKPYEIVQTVAGPQLVT
ncbi:phage portal protein [Perlucidibaca piscinae]|uniref:phage portal protein n=1 Tax=Perlucidibaca piscinae TaxID=392589 RepID=UPI0003B3BC42|nr:phage portal protein [Perlucidibaca piscinae]